MPYDPDLHHRRSVRLPDYNYARPGAYFVTLCTHNRECLFGEVTDGRMQLSVYGKIADQEWRRSEIIRAEIRLDTFVTMPNHLHGIAVILPPGVDCEIDPRGYCLHPTVGPHGRAALPGNGTFLLRKPRSLGSFIAGYKSAVTKRINTLRGTPGAPVWQYKFYDRIIRTEKEWKAIRRYIEQNPAKWPEDRNNPEWT